MIVVPDGVVSAVVELCTTWQRVPWVATSIGTSTTVAIKGMARKPWWLTKQR